MSTDEQHNSSEEWLERLAAQNKEIVALNERLLANIKTKLPELETLWDEMNSHWGYEDPIYRFYYQSFKVYGLQDQTRQIVTTLESLAPEGVVLSETFRAIVAAGAGGKQFELEHNREWTRHTRPFVEAFLHARFFLEMAVKYGRELDNAPNTLPSGWAALLCLYDMR